MAIRKNYLQIKKVRRNKFTLPDFSTGFNLSKDESVLSPAQARECYNFDFSDGTLKDGYGVSEFTAFSGKQVSALYKYRRYDGVWSEFLICYATDGKLYYVKDGGSEVLSMGDLTLSSKPSFISYRLNGEDVVFICSPADGMYVWNGVGDAYKVDGAPKITSMALHGERLFVTVDGEKNSVWFSDDIDPTNWDASLSGGGFIQLIDERGSLNRVISYLGYVYVFRDYGITRISALGSQSDFSVSNLFVSGGKIYPDTVALCGDTVIFLASDGLYAFDGVSTRKILDNLAPLFENKQNACAGYLHGKYYVSFAVSVSDEKVGCEEGEFVNNAMLVFDLSAGVYSLTRGVDVTSFYALDSDMTVVTGDGRAGIIDKSGSYFGVALKKKWSVPKTALSDEREKVIREIYLASARSITVIFRSDEEEQTLIFEGKPTVQRKKAFMKASRIGVDFVSYDTGNCISRPTVHFNVKCV